MNSSQLRPRSMISGGTSSNRAACEFAATIIKLLSQAIKPPARESITPCSMSSLLKTSLGMPPSISEPFTMFTTSFFLNVCRFGATPVGLPTVGRYVADLKQRLTQLLHRGRNSVVFQPRSCNNFLHTVACTFEIQISLPDTHASKPETHSASLSPHA